MKQQWLRKQSLAKQLLFGFGISLISVGAATLAVNHHLVQTDLASQVRERARSITQTLEFSTEGLLEVENRSILRRIVQNYATLPAVVEIAIVSPDGLTLAHSTQDFTHHFQNVKDQAYTQRHPDLAQTLDRVALSGVETSQEIVMDGRPVLAEILPFSSTLFGRSERRGLAIAIVDLKQLRYEAERSFLTSTVVLVVGIASILLVMGILIHRVVLRPLNLLNHAVIQSKESGAFTIPSGLITREIWFLATTFERVIKELEAQDQLKSEIAQRQQAEATLRASEARERTKSQQLELTLRELRQAQTQLVQSEKMSSLGQLVAGVAHEINNPVNFIHGNVHHARQYAQDLLDLLELYQVHYPTPVAAIQARTAEIDLDFLQDDLPKLLSSMKVGADRIREIVQSLRAFSRLDEAEVKDVDIHEGLESTLMILHNRLKTKPDHPAIQVVKHYGDLPKIECYAGQLNQVFMNILSNAIDALEEHDQRRSVADVAAHPSQITISTELLGDRVRIRIADNGPGMSPQVQQRLFDPFFTTKTVGKGTGMGMSISHQVVTERHKGSLRCISAPSQGAEFVIEIPLRQSPVTQIPVGQAAAT